mmetsp:Transcript_119192/g.384854  ORF Transcript_119192/g.384854 Transcript_119192/m.384854 type:complete len:234 (+) Transcript_119192:421-1122(+)
MSSSAPCSTGTSSSQSVAAQPGAALHISTRWPARPKPVTSVQPRASCCSAMRAAGSLDRSMERRAAEMCWPRARCCISPAKRQPVPSGFVSSSLSPQLRPPFVMRRPVLPATPVTQRPRPGSGPSVVWPPARVHRAATSSRFAPAIIWKTSSCISSSLPRVTVQSASADCACAPMAKQSLSACRAAMRPKTKGSPTMDLKKSTVCTVTTSEPFCRTTAASSGASRPTRTSLFL